VNKKSTSFKSIYRSLRNKNFVMNSVIKETKIRKLFLNIMTLVSFWLFTGISSCSKDEKAMLNGDWTVEKIRVHTDSTWRFPSNSYVLTLSENKSYSIHLDINTCGGSAKFEHNQQVVFQTGACTKACCDSEFALKLMNILHTCTTYDNSDLRLQLKTNVGGQIFLIKK